ncbi:MAG: OmpA family protein [Lentisphaeria bacterium]|nr:OmpA family protein [Lentisphaeria bacterium]
MKSSLFIGMAMSALVLLSAGCGSDRPPEDLSGSDVPGAVADPSGSADGTALGGTGGDGFGTEGNNGTPGNWGDPASVGASDKDGWREADPSGNRLNMPVIYFAYDSDVLVPSETANLDKIAAYMQDKPELGLVIQGHCDQRGTEEYNRALGERRANAIRSYLVKKGVADFKIKTVSFGEDQPAVTGSGESVWRQNRRGVPVPMIIK